MARLIKKALGISDLNNTPSEKKAKVIKIRFPLSIANRLGPVINKKKARKAVISVLLPCGGSLCRINFTTKITDRTYIEIIINTSPSAQSRSIKEPKSPHFLIVTHLVNKKDSGG